MRRSQEYSESDLTIGRLIQHMFKFQYNTCAIMILYFCWEFTSAYSSSLESKQWSGLLGKLDLNFIYYSN